MIPEGLTENEFLAMDRNDVHEMFDKATPHVTGQYFTPEPMKPYNNELLVHLKNWKTNYMGKDATRKSIFNWVIPAFIALPPLVSILLGWDIQISSAIFVATIMLSVAFIWFMGKIWTWEKKKWVENVEHAERAVDKVLDARAQEWAGNTYVMKNKNIGWTEFSDFYIDGVAYHWKEEEPNRYRLSFTETKEEPERKAAKHPAK